MIADKNILVLGGSGSIGRTLVTHFLDDDPDVIRIFDNNESGMADLKRGLDDDRCRFLIGDIRDKDRLARAMDGVDVVVHTAAMKHVDLSEYNPFEAVKTNVVGLQNAIDTAIDSGVRRMVFTSSDKAVYPANTMGTTKLLGEFLVTAGNKYSGGRDIRLTSVRFGNVVDSSQSVVPLFRRQIQEGGPIELTDRRMTRFFLTYKDIANLVTDALVNTRGGEVFVRKMPAVRIEDLAEAMVETVAPRYGHDPSDITTEVVGRRIGETYHEKIMTERESNRAVENDAMYAVLPESQDNGGYLEHDGIEGFRPAEDIVRSSEDAEKLDKEGILDLLEKGDVIEEG